jgi:tetratricopeptide (TPR) repeat protein/transcriptional regulator with XRE-family HTH domain
MQRVPDTVFGRLLRHLRKQAGFSQEELAGRAGVSVQAIGALERGERRQPYPRTLRSLMDALHASEADRLALLSAAAAPMPEVDTEEGEPLMGRPPRPAQLPPDIADFTGRSDELGQIADVLGRVDQAASTAPPICAISGKAGAGKSALALHAAHIWKRRFPDVQLYATLRGQDAEPRSTGSVLAGFLRALGVSGESLPQQVEDQATLYRSLLEGRAALVVLDNALDEGQVQLLLPGSPTCAVLVTSRRPLTSLPGAELMELGDMAAADAVRLLGRIAGTGRMESQAEQTEEIVRLCGQLPLAVRIAGALLKGRPHWPLAKLVRRLADQRMRLDELRVGDLDVRASFSISYLALRGEDARVFRLLALVPGLSFSSDLVAAVVQTDRDAAEDALDRLCHAQLLLAVDNGRYTLHDLVRLFSRERLAAEESAGVSEQAFERALDWYLNFARGAANRLRPSEELATVNPHQGATEKTRAALVNFETEWSSLVQAAKQAAELERWDVVRELGNALQTFFAIQQHWIEEERVIELGQHAARELVDRRAESRFLSHLAALCHQQGRWQEATSCYEESLSISHSLNDRQGEAWALHGLGGVHRRRGELDRASQCQEASVTIFRDLGDTEGEGRALNGLGLVLSNQGLLTEAFDCYEHSHRLLREAGDQHSALHPLCNFADDLCYSGRLEEAAVRYKQHLAICDELRDRDCAVWSLSGLTRVRVRQGRLGDALRESERLLATSPLLTDRGAMARALEIASETLRACSRYEEAVAYLEQELVIRRAYGDRLYECWTLNRLAEVRCDQCMWAEATALFEQSLAIARELRAPHEEEAILRMLSELETRREASQHPAS